MICFCHAVDCITPVARRWDFCEAHAAGVSSATRARIDQAADELALLRASNDARREVFRGEPLWVREAATLGENLRSGSDGANHHDGARPVGDLRSAGKRKAKSRGT